MLLKVPVPVTAVPDADTLVSDPAASTVATVTVKSFAGLAPFNCVPRIVNVWLSP